MDELVNAENSSVADILSEIDRDAAIIRNELVTLSEINSGSFNVDGVNRTASHLEHLFSDLAPDQVEHLEVAPFRSTNDRGEWVERSLGRALRLRKRANAPLRVFFCGHLDTVFDITHPFQKSRQLDSDILNGPGVADLKGGLLVMLLALKALERSPHADRLGWEILFNPDEEIGSRSSAPLLAEAASRNHFGLIYEPAYSDGGLASERKGSGNFDLVVRGRAAHAGRNPEDGRNAIALASELAVALQGLNGQRDGLTVNVGYVHGGGALNIVPDRCVLKFNVRTSQPSDECWLQDTLDLMLTRANDRYAARGGYELELRGGITRPPKPVSAGTAQLQTMLSDCGRQIGLELAFRPTGGCCDGNNLAAHGLPNVDNLGVVGGDIHSDREWMRISSLAERGKLSALLLLRLASGELRWS